MTLQFHAMDQGRGVAGLLHCAEEGCGACGDAFVSEGRTCVWAAAHEISNYGMASVSGDVVEDNLDDPGLDLDETHAA